MRCLAVVETYDLRITDPIDFRGDVYPSSILRLLTASYCCRLRLFSMSLVGSEERQESTSILVQECP